MKITHMHTFTLIYPNKHVLILTLKLNVTYPCPSIGKGVHKRREEKMDTIIEYKLFNR